jgi:hypothetical protein
MECLGFVATLVLPRGGSFLPSAVKLSESIILMDYEHIEQTVHDTVRMHNDMHSMSFTQLYRERKQGISRPRLNESCVDPDILTYNKLEVSRMADLWNIND